MATKPSLRVNSHSITTNGARYVATNAIEIQQSFDLEAWGFPLRKNYHAVAQSFLYLLVCLNRTELFPRGTARFSTAGRQVHTHTHKHDKTKNTVNVCIVQTHIFTAIYTNRTNKQSFMFMSYMCDGRSIIMY